MDFPVVDIVDQAVSKSVNSLVGNQDVNLNTLLKMATLNEMNPLEPEKIESVLTAIKKSNAMEHYWYEKELSMTLDAGGNLVPVFNNPVQNISINGIVDVSSQGDIQSKLPEPARSE
jgi:hypothetical protein